MSLWRSLEDRCWFSNDLNVVVIISRVGHLKSTHTHISIQIQTLKKAVRVPTVLVYSTYSVVLPVPVILAPCTVGTGEDSTLTFSALGTLGTSEDSAISAPGTLGTGGDSVISASRTLGTSEYPEMSAPGTLGTLGPPK